MKDHFKRDIWIDFSIIIGSIVAAVVTLSILSANLTAAATGIINNRTLEQRQTDALANLAELERDAPVASQYTAAINKLLPDQYQLINFGDWLDGIGRRHNVVATFAFQGDPVPATPTSAGTAAFSLTATGSADDIVSFLKDLESEAPGFLLNLKGFDLRNDGTNAQLTGQGVLFFQ